MAKWRRTPRGYEGTKSTTHRIGEVLPVLMGQISSLQGTRPDLVVAAWSALVGPAIAPQSEAVSFVEGILTVKVKNSTLFSLLSQYERPRLLKELRAQFPGVDIKALLFRMG